MEQRAKLWFQTLHVVWGLGLQAQALKEAARACSRPVRRRLCGRHRWQEAHQGLEQGRYLPQSHLQGIA